MTKTGRRPSCFKGLCSKVHKDSDGLVAFDVTSDIGLSSNFYQRNVVDHDRLQNNQSGCNFEPMGAEFCLPRHVNMILRCLLSDATGLAPRKQQGGCFQETWEAALAVGVLAGVFLPFVQRLLVAVGLTVL